MFKRDRCWQELGSRQVDFYGLDIVKGIVREGPEISRPIVNRKNEVAIEGNAQRDVIHVEIFEVRASPDGIQDQTQRLPQLQATEQGHVGVDTNQTSTEHEKCHTEEATWEIGNLVRHGAGDPEPKALVGLDSFQAHPLLREVVLVRGNKGGPDTGALARSVEDNIEATILVNNIIHFACQGPVRSLMDGSTLDKRLIIAIFARDDVAVLLLLVEVDRSCRGVIRRPVSSGTCRRAIRWLVPPSTRSGLEGARGTSIGRIRLRVR